MTISKSNLAILDKFEFEIAPVGVKFLTQVPPDLKIIGRNMTLCEMLKAAQAGQAFYAAPRNHTCDAATYIMGQSEIHEKVINGEYGAGLRVFQDSRAGSKLYHYLPRIARGVVKYISLVPLKKLSFEPDVLIVFARTSQAEVMLRAMSYKTGQMWSSRYSAAVGCAWIFVYPYLTGEINYGTTGLGFGMKRRKLFPEGLHWLSIPFNVLPSFLQTLREMPWVPPPYQEDGVEFVKKLKTELGLG
jgi:uncharacterized protein (DUF169 family)